METIAGVKIQHACRMPIHQTGPYYHSLESHSDWTVLPVQLTTIGCSLAPDGVQQHGNTLARHSKKTTICRACSDRRRPPSSRLESGLRRCQALVDRLVVVVAPERPRGAKLRLHFVPDLPHLLIVSYIGVSGAPNFAEIWHRAFARLGRVRMPYGSIWAFFLPGPTYSRPRGAQEAPKRAPRWYENPQDCLGGTQDGPRKPRGGHNAKLPSLPHRESQRGPQEEPQDLTQDASKLPPRRDPSGQPGDPN